MHPQMTEKKTQVATKLRAPPTKFPAPIPHQIRIQFTKIAHAASTEETQAINVVILENTTLIPAENPGKRSYR